MRGTRNIKVSFGEIFDGNAENYAKTGKINNQLIIKI